MNQHIGNIGLLNLLQATEESVQGIERIDNVGMIIFNKETAPLISALNIGNIGKSLELPEGYRLVNGILTIDDAYLQSMTEPAKLLINGLVVIGKEVQTDQLNAKLSKTIISGKIYTPRHLYGAVNNVLANSETLVNTYDHLPPRIENGTFSLTNAYLNSLEEPQYLVVNGKLQFAENLDMDLFREKIEGIDVNGLITLYEPQEPFLFKKIASLTTCKVEKYPEGYEVVKKTLRLNGRSIRRYQNKKLFTSKPIIFDKDVEREQLAKAIASIHSTSIIVCHEDIEDLIYERSINLDSEVLTYENSFVMVEGEETWSNEQLLAFEKPVNFIINGQLTLSEDVEEEVLRKKVAAFDILGELLVSDKKLKGHLHQQVRLNTGIIEEKMKTKEDESYLGNIGELTL